MLALFAIFVRGGTPEDKRLLSRVAAGDEDALRGLYDRHAARLLGTARRILGNVAEAEEVVQETFIDIWHRAATFDAQKGTATSWINSMGRNRAIDRLRSKTSAQRAVAGAEAEPLPDGPPTPESQLALAENKESVVAALDRLAPELRSVVELAFFHGMTQTQIAKQTGSPLGTVKGRARTALRQLADHFAKELA